MRYYEKLARFVLAIICIFAFGCSNSADLQKREFTDAIKQGKSFVLIIETDFPAMLQIETLTWDSTTDLVTLGDGRVAKGKIDSRDEGISLLTDFLTHCKRRSIGRPVPDGSMTGVELKIASRVLTFEIFRLEPNASVDEKKAVESIDALRLLLIHEL